MANFGVVVHAGFFDFDFDTSNIRRVFIFNIPTLRDNLDFDFNFTHRRAAASATGCGEAVRDFSCPGHLPAVFSFSTLCDSVRLSATTSTSTSNVSRGSPLCSLSPASRLLLARKSLVADGLVSVPACFPGEVIAPGAQEDLRVTA